MLILDTDVIIDVQRRHPPATVWFASLADLPHVPGFVVMELMQSARNKKEFTAANGSSPLSPLRGLARWIAIKR